MIARRQGTSKRKMKGWVFIKRGIGLILRVGVFDLKFWNFSACPVQARVLERLQALTLWNSTASPRQNDFCLAKTQWSPDPGKFETTNFGSRRWDVFSTANIRPSPLSSHYYKDSNCKTDWNNSHRMRDICGEKRPDVCWKVFYVIIFSFGNMIF